MKDNSIIGKDISLETPGVPSSVSAHSTYTEQSTRSEYSTHSVGATRPDPANVIIEGCFVFDGSGFVKKTVCIKGGKLSFDASGISAVPSVSVPSVSSAVSVHSSDVRKIVLENKYIIPGLTDVHVHFREPGFSYKETIRTGSLAAAAGGYTAVCTMPNLSPAPDSPETLAKQLEQIKKDAVIDVFPYGTITAGRKGGVLSDMEGMKDIVCGFSDDGSGVQDEETMRAAMLEAKRLGKIIAAHCEVDALLKKGGCVHDGEFARASGLIGISSESEWKQIERDLRLVRETGCKYHVCHISTKESVELIRRAKAEGLDVTCETGPHYLTMCDRDLRDEGRFKMNPPIRSAEDRDALIEGLRDGTIDMIATDHAPHSAEEKSKGLAGSLMGVVGLETAFAVVYTDLVLGGVITPEKLISLMCIAPRKRFLSGKKPVGLCEAGMTGKADMVGETDVADLAGTADFAVFDLDEEYEIDSGDFLSMGKASPFEGKRVRGRCLMTVCDGRIVYEKGEKDRK